MAGIDSLKDRIIKESKYKSELIKSEAKSKANSIENEAKEGAKKIIHNAKSEALKEGNDKKERIKSAAYLEARNKEISAKQKAIDMVFDKAIYRISSMSKYEYTNFIKDLLINNVEIGNEEVVMSKIYENRIEDNMIDDINKYLISIGKKGELKIKNDDKIISSGFILKRDDVEINCTIDSIAMSLRDRIDTEIANIIFDK